jgi:hypothetical protein
LRALKTKIFELFKLLEPVVLSEVRPLPVASCPQPVEDPRQLQLVVVVVQLHFAERPDHFLHFVEEPAKKDGF